MSLGHDGELTVARTIDSMNLKDVSPYIRRRRACAPRPRAFALAGSSGGSMRGQWAVLGSQEEGRWA
jgi:hypothetical protein